MLQELYQLWRTKSKNGRLPARADFDPLEMRAFLGSIFLVTAEPGGEDFRYTLIGTTITQHVGRDNTNRCVGDVFGAAGLALYGKCREAGRPVRVHGVVDWRDKEHKAYETLLLPLADDGRSVDRFIGGMVFGPASASPAADRRA
jgi:hypothetical protein